MLSFQDWSPLRPARFAGLDHYEEMLFDDDVFWQALWQHADLHRERAGRHRAGARHSRCSSTADIRGARHLPHHRLPVLSADDGRGRHHLALDVSTSAVGLINYVAALAAARRPADSVPAIPSTWALPCVIVANIWQMLGFYMIILLTGLQSIPQNLYEAARDRRRRRPAHASRASRCRCCSPRCSSAS